MVKYEPSPGPQLILAIIWVFFVLNILNPAMARSHGGKNHAGEPFSALQAVQKATQLYDRLITSEKLPEDWETTLSSIHVSIRGNDNSREYVVQFKRSNGDPNSVYFYFDREGNYSGSNFTGK